MRRAASYLAGLQARDGHWCAELTADTTLESDYILFQLWLYPPVDGKWNPDTRPQIDRAALSILARQLPDGGFNIYVEGPSEVSASVKAYFALKLAGVPDTDPRMEKLLHARILDLGGIQAANSYVKVNLSLFDVYPAAILPEHSTGSGAAAVRSSLPDVRMDAGDRGVAVDCPCGQSATPGARRVQSRRIVAPRRESGVSSGRWLAHLAQFFLTVDKLLKWWERSGCKAIRRKAMEKAKAG